MQFRHYGVTYKLTQTAKIINLNFSLGRVRVSDLICTQVSFKMTLIIAVTKMKEYYGLLINHIPTIMEDGRAMEAQMDQLHRGNIRNLKKIALFSLLFNMRFRLVKPKNYTLILQGGTQERVMHLAFLSSEYPLMMIVTYYHESGYISAFAPWWKKAA